MRPINAMVAGNKELGDCLVRMLGMDTSKHVIFILLGHLACND